MVAMRFKTYKEDTLRAVQMYFNQVLNDANQYTFKLHVWSNSDDKPGSIIYTQEGLKPQNSDELNQFVTFKLDDEIILNGNFFIGWQKISTTEMLNVGFDVNKVNNDKLYYNFSGNWVKSQLEGTVMIRPVFGKEFNIATGIDNPSTNRSIDYSIYPNPAQETLNININNDTFNQYAVTVFDIYGKLYIDKSLQDSYIDVSDLNAGIYFIRISNTTGANTTQKFIIVR